LGIGSDHSERSGGPFCLIRGSILIYSVSRFSFHFVFLVSLLALLRVFHVGVFQQSQIAGFHPPFPGRQGCESDRRLTAGSLRAGTVGWGIGGIISYLDQLLSECGRCLERLWRV